MRILILSAVLLVMSSRGYAQTVDNVPLDSIQTQYIQIVGVQKFLSTKVTVHIEFGQHNKVFSNKDTELRDEEGNRIVFNSMIDALNFMNENGYEFVQAYAITYGSQNVYHYIMRKKPDQG